MRIIALLILALSTTVLGTFTPVAISLAASVETHETQTVTLDVENMTCSMCPITVRKALEKVPGVIKAKASYKTRTATVTFDPGKTNVEALTQATTNAGYPSTLKPE